MAKKVCQRLPIFFIFSGQYSHTKVDKKRKINSIKRDLLAAMEKKNNKIHNTLLKVLNLFSSIKLLNASYTAGPTEPLTSLMMKDTPCILDNSSKVKKS